MHTARGIVQERKNRLFSPQMARKRCAKQWMSGRGEVADRIANT
jgi:hypothetical protein